MSEIIINPPHTYFEWVKVFDILKTGKEDDAVLEAMMQGSIEWQSGVAERFSQKLIEVVNSRMNAASDNFQKKISRAYGQESIIVQALLGLRKEMKYLVKVMSISAIPEKQRVQYQRLVLEQADLMQKSLEDSAKSDRTGKLANIVRNNRINAIREEI